MNLRTFALKVLYSNELLYNIYKRDHCKYHLNLFEKKKYRFLLSNKNFKYNDDIFYYHINTNMRVNYNKNLVCNIPINQKMLINTPLNDLLNNCNDKKYVMFMKAYFEKIKSEVSKSSSENRDKILNVIDNLFTNKSESLFDALQRILFINQLLWQTGHKLNGLGRLDFVLNDVYIKSGISYKDAKNLVYNFLRILHIDYYYKSNVLKGDTGQIVILGGLNENGDYFSNDLTHIFIECIKELQKPDPKVLLRVSKNMPDSLLDEALDCIKTGCGSPLLSNDGVVIPSLLDIGYSKKDACNYATSACWEPLCDGASLEQNNIGDLNFVSILNNTLNCNIDSFETLLNGYKENIKLEINNMTKRLNKFKFAYDPLLSTFLSDCNVNKKDVSNGGARYNNFGILTTGLGNAIDALINIKTLIYDEKSYKMDYLINQMNHNFTDEILYNKLKNNKLRYGKDDEFVLNLTNEIVDLCNLEFSKYKNNFGGIYRFGLSSPNYISNSCKTKASLDGRRDFEPFIVHISSNAECSYTEIVNFASGLHYGKRNVNGNVIDMMLSPSTLENNFEKFKAFLKIAINNGIFQVQFNVIDSATLIKAKENPEQYKNLIVRVWGFSAYFIELPLEYQELLIRRAKLNEGAC